MIVARNIGRLGNNMLQIACAIGYAKKYGYKWAADYGNGLGEPYSSIHKVFPNLPKAELSGVRYHEHNNEFCRLHNQHKDICHFDYHPIPDLGANVALTGFFQSWKYFENAQEEVKKVFELPHIVGYEDYVSIHWRLGDYLQHSGSFPPITKEYIKKAMEFFPDKTRFIVFSDDIKYCKLELSDMTNFEYSEGKNEREDLSLMASCGSHIISNSTFSYWAGILGHNENRIVVSPSHQRGSWFGLNSGVLKDCVDLIPPTWKEIKIR